MTPQLEAAERALRAAGLTGAVLERLLGACVIIDRGSAANWWSPRTRRDRERQLRRLGVDVDALAGPWRR